MQEPHLGILATPLDHPLFHSNWGVARSQQCIGVIDITTADAQSQFYKRMLDRGWCREVLELCQKFGNSLYECALQIGPITDGLMVD